MRRIVLFALSVLMLCVFCSCGVQKQITVIVREQGSGTREAFDKAVGDGTHFLEERDGMGKKLYNTSKTAIQQTKNGTVLSAVMHDKNAIGYVSVGSLKDTVKVVSVDGVAPSEESVLSGDYKIQRPYVIMTKKGQSLTPLTEDFMSYLKSQASAEHSGAAGCVFLTDPQVRANSGESPIEVLSYTVKDSLPEGKIIVRGSTSIEKFIKSAAKGYADMYGADAGEIFNIQLEGSSIGQRAVTEDTQGNVVGLSSAWVNDSRIESFNVCLDAVAVVVNKENNAVSDLSLAQLYDIFSGKIKSFSQMENLS